MSAASDESELDEWMQEINGIDDIAYFDKNKNELLRNWIKVSHLIDDINDDVLSLCLKSIIDLFGGFKLLLKELVSQSSNNKQLETLFNILKQTNNEYMSQNSTSNVSDYCDIDVKIKNVASLSISLHDFQLNQLPSELLSYICGYLERRDITLFKMVSWQIGVVCLKEMSKISIGIINANKLIMRESSMIQFTKLNTNNRQKSMEIESEIKSLKSQIIDLDCHILTENGLKQTVKIKKEKLKIISMIKKAKTKRKALSLECQQVFDISNASFMQNERMPLNTKFSDVFDAFGDKYNIEMKHQIIYHFNYPFYLFKLDEMRNEIQLNNATQRQFIIFDERKIFELNKTKHEKNKDKNRKLILIKHYDIETEKLYFVCFLIIGIDVKIIDLINYLQYEFINNLYQSNKSDLTASTKWYYRLYVHLQNMRNDNISKKLRIYKESQKKTKYFINTSETINKVVENGEILIFQLNFIHSYFRQKSEIFKQIILTKEKTKWYFTVDDFLLDAKFKRIISVRQQNYFTIYYFKNNSNLNINNLKYYLQKYVGINNNQELNKILMKIQNMLVLKISVCPTYSFGYFRKCISDSMDNVIKAQNIHLYDIKNKDCPTHLEWNDEWRNREMVCEWSIVPFNTQNPMVINYTEYSIFAIKIYKTDEIPTPFFKNDVKFIIIKFKKDFIVKNMIKHLIFCMTQPIVEYKYKDIIQSLNGGNECNIYNEFNFVLCVGAKYLNGFGINEQVTNNYYNPNDIDYILPMHLFIIPKVKINLKPNEIILYIRFMFKPLAIGSGEKYFDVCCGLPVKIVIKYDESLQSIIDGGKLLKYNVLKVLSCYRVKNKENTQIQIKRKRLNEKPTLKTWDHYKPFENFLKQNPMDHIAMNVVVRNSANTDKSEQRCVIGNCLFE